MFKTIKHIHFVGIGGSGMSGIAEVLLTLGYKVTGSDKSKSAVTNRLEHLGAQISEGHNAQYVDGANVVVTSTAISQSNPEVKAARKAGIPVIPRIEMLAELARLKYTVAIGGTHGKTTTTSLIGHMLQRNGLDPTVIVGGRLKSFGTGGVLGKGEFLVAEADESDGSFLKLSPAISVITNIDNDHLDYYGSMKKLDESFAEFSDHIPFYGITFLCGDDKGVRRILPKLKRRFETYGLGPKNDLRAENLTASETDSRYDVIYKGELLGQAQLPIPGRHNVLNSLAAIGVGLQLGISFEKIIQSLSSFEGVGRRLEVKGQARGVIVVDDYGHHPTEMAATYAAAKERWPNRRVVVLFQPHRYTRTRDLYREFGAVLSKMERVILMPIYSAGEDPIRGISSGSIAKYTKGKGKTRWDEKKGFEQLFDELKQGDVLLTLGAGDVWKIGEMVLKEGHSLRSRLLEAVPALATRVKAEEPLARHCTWAIGGPAELYIEIETLGELRGVQAFCRNERVPFFILGWGSNVLLPDEGLRGVVVRLRGEFEKIDINGERVTVGAGVHLPKLAKRCAEKSLSGTEALAGVPGTVGGALMTNAGTPRGVIGDVVDSVSVLNPDGTTQTLMRDQLDLRYRHSNLNGRWVVSASLVLKPSNNGDALQKMKAELEMRAKTQPLGTKNVGSVFKNPPNDFAARLIEAAGLKGHREGRVRVSPKHANFIENVGGATAKEALALIHRIQNTVKDKFGVDLVLEVNVVSPTA
jgi:UDP-N-acetylmuramate--alanine ligase